VALHEFGHVLGLDHPDDDGQFAQAIMKSAVGSLDDLQPDDINGGRFLWAGTLPWRAIILPESGTLVQTETAGSMQVKFSNGRGNGGFSGKVWFDGRVTVFRGVATNSNGNLLFGKSNGAMSPFHFPNHWDRTLAFSWTESGLKSTFEDPWLINLGVASTMSGILRSPRYHNKQPVPSWLLNSPSKGLYNIAVPSNAQTPPRSAATYPQGIGALATTLTRSGGLRLRGVLADGTKVTASSHLSDKTPFYVSFRTPGQDMYYNKRPRGSFLGELEFDTSLVNTDVRGINWMWFRGRSWVNSSKIPYSEGWPEGILVDLAGTKYYADNRFFTIQEAMDLAPSDWILGNARLQFTDGKLPTTLTMGGFNIEGSKAIKISSVDNRSTLKMNAKTGWIHGNFTPNWLDSASKLPTFQGVVLHKGANKGAYGFFISNRVNDTQPESGRVILRRP
jgi:hypothetical protein